MNFSSKLLLIFFFSELKSNHFVENSTQFFFNSSDIGNPNAVEMRKDLAEFDNFTAPGVEMHCLYGNNTGDTVDEYLNHICAFLPREP